jgi:competence protein ComEA
MPRYSRHEAFVVLALAVLVAFSIWVPDLFSRLQTSDFRPETQTWSSNAAPSQPPLEKKTESRRQAGKPRLEGPIDLNRSGREALQALPGIGPVLADRIVKYRERFGPFTAAEEVMGVEGIGERRYERIKPLVVVGTVASKEGKR